MAYKFKIRKEDRVAIAFFGEGASSRGDVHEAMNFAGVHKLPVIFVCENNFYAYSTPNELQFGVDNVADRAVGYGFKGEVVNGNDLHCRDEDGAEGDRPGAQGRRPDAGGVQDVPVSRPLRARPGATTGRRKRSSPGRAGTRSSSGRSTSRRRKYDIAAIRKETTEEVTRIVEEAVAFAEASPSPEGPEAMEDLYAMPIDTEAR